MNPCLLGIEIGGTKLQLVWGNAEIGIRERRTFKVDSGAGALGIRSRIESALRDPSLPHPQAVGIGFGGPVDWRTGQVCCSHQIEGWSEFDLGSWITHCTGAPVRVDNDANTAALAEALLGSGKDRDPVFYVTLGSGVGGGLAAGQRVFHGQLPGEAEIGHLRLDRNGTTVEDRCSGWAVNQAIQGAVRENPQCLLAALVTQDPGHEARHLGPALAANDPLAERILTDLATDLTFALSHVTHLMHPEIIVLGGGLSLVGDPLRAAVADRLPSAIMEAFRPGPTIALSQLAEDAVPTGALLLAGEAATLGS
jgi:glucokinase